MSARPPHPGAARRGIKRVGRGGGRRAAVARDRRLQGRGATRGRTGGRRPATCSHAPRMPMTALPARRGIAVMELVVVALIVIVLLAIAVPRFTRPTLDIVSG